MGSGKWSASTYHNRARARGGRSAFAYSSGATGVHPTLNPYGLTYRESHDSAEHPDSNSIIIGLDVTGSMGAAVYGIHEDLPQLHELILGHNYIPDPQIMFCAFSNGTCDRVPLQIGQFESDNRMDENLENMIIGGALAGGCDNRESGELILYVAARHTKIDCWEKRQHKGYVFLITDEMGYEDVKRDEIKDILGGGLQANLPIENIAAEVKQRYHLYVIIPAGAQGGDDPKVYDFWKRVAGPQNVIRLEMPEDVSETIALTIGLTEGTIGMDDGVDHLRKIGSSTDTIDTVTKALSVVSGGGGGSLVKGSGLSDLTTTDDDGGGSRTRRL